MGEFFKKKKKILIVAVLAAAAIVFFTVDKNNSGSLTGEWKTDSYEVAGEAVSKEEIAAACGEKIAVYNGAKLVFYYDKSFTAEWPDSEGRLTMVKGNYEASDTRVDLGIGEEIVTIAHADGVIRLGLPEAGVTVIFKK